MGLLDAFAKAVVDNLFGFLKPAKVKTKQLPTPTEVHAIQQSQAAGAAAHRASRQVTTDMRRRKAIEAYEQAQDAVEGFEQVVRDLQAEIEDEDTSPSRRAEDVQRLTEYQARLKSWRQRLEARKVEMSRLAF